MQAYHNSGHHSSHPGVPTQHANVAQVKSVHTGHVVQAPRLCYDKNSTLVYPQGAIGHGIYIDGGSIID
jgi:hypothetical protein